MLEIRPYSHSALTRPALAHCLFVHHCRTVSIALQHYSLCLATCLAVGLRTYLSSFLSNSYLSSCQPISLSACVPPPVFLSTGLLLAIYLMQCFTSPCHALPLVTHCLTHCLTHYLLSHSFIHCAYLPSSLSGQKHFTDRIKIFFPVGFCLAGCEFSRPATLFNSLNRVRVTAVICPPRAGIQRMRVRAWW